MTWVGIARSNYFRVLNGPAFLEALVPFDEVLTAHEDRSVENKGFCFIALVDYGWHEQDKLTGLVAPHLADGEVCVLIETGFNRRSYGTGNAIAFNNKGDERRVDIADIYTLAKELGGHCTPAEY